MEALSAIVQQTYTYTSRYTHDSTVRHALTCTLFIGTIFVSKINILIMGIIKHPCTHNNAHAHTHTSIHIQLFIDGIKYIIKARWEHKTAIFIWLNRVQKWIGSQH